MLNIAKRSGKQELFTRSKIHKSIRNAGADEKLARIVSDVVNHKEDMKTSDVRKRVIEQLTYHDTKLGKAYKEYRKPVLAEM